MFESWGVKFVIDLIFVLGVIVGVYGDDFVFIVVFMLLDVCIVVELFIMGEQLLVWVFIEFVFKKCWFGFWIGFGVGVVVLGVGVVFMIFIVFGMIVVGILVGWMILGVVVEVIVLYVVDIEVIFIGVGDGVVFIGVDLGVIVDVVVFVDIVFVEYLMWNFGVWMGDFVFVDIVFDFDMVFVVLCGVVFVSFEDLVDVGVVFDVVSGIYVIILFENGIGIDVVDFIGVFVDVIVVGCILFEYLGDFVQVIFVVIDDDVIVMVIELNLMFGMIGFYVGEECIVFVVFEVVVFWLMVVDEDGQLCIEVDLQVIQVIVDMFFFFVDWVFVNVINIVDFVGNVLCVEWEGVVGCMVGDILGVVDQFVQQFVVGDGVFKLLVSEIVFESVNFFCCIEINFSLQWVYLFENNEVVWFWVVFIGFLGMLMLIGNFKVFVYMLMQDMGCYEGVLYCMEDVFWIMWFVLNIGFYGIYWYNNFGNWMSYGCVNLLIDFVKYVYDWLFVGFEVFVYN